MFTFYILSYRIVVCMCVYDMLYLLNQFVPMEQYVDERKIQQSQGNSCSRYFHGRRKEHRILTSSIGFDRGLYQLVTHVTHGSLVWVYFVPVIIVLLTWVHVTMYIHAYTTLDYICILPCVYREDGNSSRNASFHYGSTPFSASSLGV